MDPDKLREADVAIEFTSPDSAFGEYHHMF
jgi:hypothetical protein